MKTLNNNVSRIFRTFLIAGFVGIVLDLKGQEKPTYTWRCVSGENAEETQVCSGLLDYIFGCCGKCSDLRDCAACCEHATDTYGLSNEFLVNCVIRTCALPRHIE